MADLSSVLTPSVAPDRSAPDDTLHVNASPESFGGLIAKGTEQLGQGAERASSNLFDSSKFFGQVAADNASNDYQDYATKLLHGDPNKMVTGPDGTQQPDTGYLGLRGRAALDARPDIAKALDERLEQTRSTLTSPEQQLQFDNFSRRFRAGAEEKIGTHADGQATTWYQSVNSASAKLALDHIALNADNPQSWQAGEADLVHAYVKTAQLHGAEPGDDVYNEAVANARRDALKTRLDAVAVKDPSRAISILDMPENKAIAGQYYDNMSSAYRGRAKQQQGYGLSDGMIKNSYESNPAVNPVTLSNAAAKYGVSTDYMIHAQLMETGHNPNQTSSTGAQGPFQFVGSTAKQYGVTDPFNYQQSADGAAHLAADNKNALTGSLGRPPSDPELYLAHNQGAGGAAKLLQNPNVRAGDLLPAFRTHDGKLVDPIRDNGGDPNAPAIAFTSMMTQKYNAAPVAATQSRKAKVIGDILAIPDDQIDPDVRQHAIAHAEQTFAAQAVAEERDAKAKHESQEALQGKMVATIIRGAGPEIIKDIADAADKGQLTPPQATELYGFVTTKGGVEDPLSFGTGYTDAMKRIMAPADDPSKISSAYDIIKLRNDGALTRKGAGELISTMQLIQKQPDQAGVTTVKSHQLDYYKSKMAIDDEMSAITGKPFKNQKGLDHFNHDFVPAFESAYSKWVGAGKDPMEFLTDSKQMDAIMDRVYPPAQRAKDAVSAGAGAGKPVDMTIPPVPEGLNKNTFETIVKHPPVGVDGTQWSPTAFATAIDRLRSTPTPEMKAGFNKYFGKAGFDADEILKKLPAKPQKQADAGPIDKLLSDNAVTPNPNAPEGPGPAVAVGIRG